MATFADSDAFDVVIAGGGVKDMNVNIGGEWKNATPSVLVAGEWKPVDAYVLIGGVWKPVHEQ